MTLLEILCLDTVLSLFWLYVVSQLATGGVLHLSSVYLPAAWVHPITPLCP